MCGSVFKEITAALPRCLLFKNLSIGWNKTRNHSYDILQKIRKERCSNKYWMTLVAEKSISGKDSSLNISLHRSCSNSRIWARKNWIIQTSRLSKIKKRSNSGLRTRKGGMRYWMKNASWRDMPKEWIKLSRYSISSVIRNRSMFSLLIYPPKKRMWLSDQALHSIKTTAIKLTLSCLDWNLFLLLWSMSRK